MIFSEKFSYCREKGLGTTNLQLPIKVFEQNHDHNSQDVDFSIPFWNRFTLEVVRLAQILKEAKIAR